MEEAPNGAPSNWATSVEEAFEFELHTPLCPEGQDAILLTNHPRELKALLHGDQSLFILKDGLGIAHHLGDPSLKVSSGFGSTPGLSRRGGFL